MPHLQTTNHFLPLFDPTHPDYSKPFLTWYGGRGGMKSWQIARGVLMRGTRKPLNVLCTREYQNSIGDSVLSVLEGQAELLGLVGYYRFFNTYVAARNGTEIAFKGLQKNINSIKSFEGIDLLWNEEAEHTSKKSIEKLYPTIRKEGAQIITSFNPDQAKDPIYVEHVVNHDPEIQYLCKVNYTDNPFIDSAWIQRALKMRDTDYDAYAHIYLGECWTRSDAQVFNGKWEVREFEEPDSPQGGPYYGLDFGFSQDPTFATKSWVDDDCLYIGYEMSKIGLELDDTAPALIRAIPGIEKAKIRADCSRPETIAHLRRKGLDVVGAEKWDGSVEDGITVLRSFKRIFLHPRCRNMIEEARLYSYKVDKLTSDVLPVIVDKHNHGWDAERYALAPLIKRKPKGFFDV